MTAGNVLRFGPTPTPHGPVTVEVVPTPDAVAVRWEANWRARPPRVEVAVPGCELREGPGDVGALELPRGELSPLASTSATRGPLDSE